MAQVIIRNIDDDVVASLKARAERERKSLEQLLRDVLRREARPSAEELIANAKRIQAMGKPTPAHMNATDLIREDRDNDHGHDW